MVIWYVVSFDGTATLPMPARELDGVIRKMLADGASSDKINISIHPEED